MADDPVGRLVALGFSVADATAIDAHFADADRRGKPSHGRSRIAFLERLHGLDPTARPRLLSDEGGLQRWDGNGAVGYLTLAAICEAQLADPPAGARLVVAERTFPTGMLGYWVRRLAEGGLVALLTATSPRRLPHPDGGAPLTGTNPLAIGVPGSDGRPLVCDVSMGRATHGDVLLGRATEADLVPFGGPHAHKAFALAIGLELLVGALAGEEHGAVLLVANPEHDPVPGLRALAGGLRLPGDA